MEIIEIPEVKRKRSRRGFGVAFVIIVIVIALLYIFLNELVGSLLDSFTRRTVHFSEMEYTRPDSDAIMDMMDEAIYSISNNVDKYSEQLDYLRKLSRERGTVNTMYALAMIHSSQDTTDQFYVDEMDFFADFLPELGKKTEDLLVACAQSKHREKFERDYWGEDELEDYVDGGTMTEKSVELEQRAQSLANQFLVASANPIVEYNGEKQPFYDMISDGDLSPEDYYGVISAYYDQYNPIFGDLYVQIVKDNMEAAKEQGFDSFIDYIYDDYERDYSPEDAARFAEDIKQYFVPLYRRLSDDGYYDSKYTGFSCDDELMASALEYVADEMGGRVSYIYDFMLEYGLCDFKMSDKKEQQSYTTYLSDYDAPFIIVNPTGSDDDILTAIHEFGHFTDRYINYGYDMGIDCGETVSQGLEYLSMFYLDGFINDDDLNVIRAKKLIDTVDVFVYQGYLNELETRVYSLSEDEVTLDKINELSAECAEEFGFDAPAAIPDYYKYSWIDVPHLYDAPFYVISYCTSCDAALQFYELAEEDRDNAVETYYDLINWDIDQTFTENLQRAGLDSPFDEDSVKECAAAIESYFYE